MAVRSIVPRSTPSFASILDMPVDRIEKPKPLPEGTYLMQVKGQAEPVKAKTGTDGIKFTYQFIQATDDVDAGDLALAGGLEGKTISSNTTAFYLTEKTHWRLKEFLEETLGIPTVDEDSEEDPETGLKSPLSLRQMLAFAPGKRFWAAIKHVHPKDDDGKPRLDVTFMEIAKTANINFGQPDEEEGEEPTGEFDE